MVNLKNVLALLRKQWAPQRRSPARGRQSRPKLEPLETRAMLAGEFTDLGASGLPNLVLSSVAWGDADNDGDLDVLIAGRMTGAGAGNVPVTKVYDNNGSGSFTENTNSSLIGVFDGSVAWGDADNDGDLDILITGEDSTSSSVTKVYRNNGHGAFTDLIAGLPGVAGGDAAWGDADNDGDLDILLTGSDNTLAAITKVYRNNGDGSFTDSNASLVGMISSSVAWGDADNDGDLDILLAGRAGNSINDPIVSKVYTNNGSGGFTENTNAGLAGVRVGSVEWGDVDNDGDLDILLTGSRDPNSVIAKVYRNNGDGTFSDINAGLFGIYGSDATWGDADNDGDLDILLSGKLLGGTWLTKVFQNNGNSTFTELDANLTGLQQSSVAWGDADGDGDLEILATGLDPNANWRTTVYRNNAALGNLTPSAPTALTSTVVSSTALRFSWTAPTDVRTPSAGLSYNLRVGTTPGGSDVFSTMTDSANNKRRLTRVGPIQGTSYTLKGLNPTKTYYWSVQAIDTTFAGGTFATEQIAYTGSFTDLNTALASVELGSVAWGDADNDGDLDVLLTGNTGSTRIAKVYANNGSGGFTETANLTGVSSSSVAWGDADKDGDLDIILTGNIGANVPVTKIYTNNGSGSFTENVAASLAAVFDGSVAWGDADNDGDLDILLTGRDSSSASVAKIYTNNGTGGFTENTAAGLVGVQGSSVAWGDVDKDGDLDIILAGFDASFARVTKVYRNNGNNTFTDLNVSLPGISSGSVALGDADNDGDLDLVLAGQTAGYTRIAKVYANNGSGGFTEYVNAILTGVDSSSVAWGDADNDGKLDILLTGSSANSFVAKVYKGSGSGLFTEQTNIGLTGVQLSSAAWGDVDNDGDLDILVTGSKAGATPITRLYRNNVATTNTAPNVPTALTATAASNTALTFSWTAPTDSQTPSAGLSYNLRVGTTPGGSDVFSTMSSIANGKRRLPDAGPIQGTNYILTGLDPAKTYYWSVQAIDTAFAGSAFATEQSAFSGPFTDLAASAVRNVQLSSVAWGDSDNDGDLDILVSGSGIGNVPVAKVYVNNGSGSFTENTSAILSGVRYSAVAWGDADNDGDLDILLTGRDASNTRIAKVYRNNGNGTFTDIAAGLTGVQFGSVAWGDADNDGDLDIILTGRDATNARIAKVYRNNGNGTFTDSNAGLTGVTAGSVAWGDADNDGDLDILLTGSSDSGPVAKVYTNNGSGTFTVNASAGLTGVYYSSVAWGDVDNNGDLDILLAGFDGSTPLAKVYRNNGNSTFTDLNANLTGVQQSSVALGDVDNDGDLDLLLTGADTGSTRIAKLYKNSGNATFTESTGTGFIGVANSSVAWGDADNDGDLDVLLSGRTASSSPLTKVYRNNAAATNTAPNVPTGLTSLSASNTALTFSWTPPTDGQTPSAGLSYNLRVGTTPGGSDVFSTMAVSSNGKRRLADAGPIQGTSYTLKGLDSTKTYYWSVQAIDTALTGGAFASEKTGVPNNAPAISGVLASQTVNDNATIAPFAGVTVTDPGNQNMLAKVTIMNGMARGDFTTASTSGWTRTVTGNNIIYSRFYNPAANIGAIVQTDVRTLVFQPRNNAIKPNTTELTDIALFVNDGQANTTATTRLVTTSVNDAPSFGGTPINISANDNSTVNPFSTLTVSDADLQEMLISVTILNGTVRGDFTAASTTDWAVRYIIGNNITYKRYFSPGPNVGATVQAAFRALVFQPRSNAIKPGTTEATDFQVTVSDGVAPAILGTGLLLTTTSINDVPAINGAIANQTMNDDATKSLFSTLTVVDADYQETLARVTINNGVNRGDFTSGSSTGWTRSVSGTNLIYTRYFAATANVGASVEAAIRALVFQPRNNVPASTTETTTFTVFINDGQVNVSNSTTSVITTGVAPRSVGSRTFAAPAILDADISTVVLPTIRKSTANGLARLLKRAR